MEDAVSARGMFCMALSGGSALDLLATALGPEALPPSAWSAWRVFWVDERCVPFSSGQSNAGAAVRHWLAKLPIPGHQIIPVNGEIDPVISARDYERKMAEVLCPGPGEFPRFDLMILGVGEDGHVASLFPDQPALAEQHRWVLPVFQAPKPPPTRITLTMPVILHARYLAVIAVGAAKRDIVRRALDPHPGPPRLPIQRLRAGGGNVRWFLDEAAAAGLDEQDQRVDTRL